MLSQDTDGTTKSEDPVKIWVYTVSQFAKTLLSEYLRIITEPLFSNKVFSRHAF